MVIKKLYVLICVFLFAVSLVSAEMNIDIRPDSNGGDINTWVYPNSGVGETNYYLDDINYKDEEATQNKMIIDNIPGGIDEYFYALRTVFEEETNPNSGIYKPVSFNSLNTAQQKYRHTMEDWFVTRNEMIQVINQQQSQIQQLSYEVKALKKLANETLLCQAKMQVVKEYNLTSVNCGDTIYYNHLEGDSLIGLRQIE